MKATHAAFTYGGPDYPVADANLPDVPIEAAIKAVLDQMSRLSGGFALAAPSHIRLDIIGDGYSVRLDSAAEADRLAAEGWGKYPDPVRAERESMRQYAG